MRKIFLLLKLIIKHRNFNFIIYFNPPDFHFLYVVEMDKNNFYNNAGYHWMSDAEEMTDLWISEKIEL